MRADGGAAVPGGGPVPPISGLARSIQRMFEEGKGGAGAAGLSRAAGSTGAEAVRKVAALRERFTNRVARYLGGDSETKASLREGIEEDGTQLLAAGEVGALADAVRALSGPGDANAGGAAAGGALSADPLLPLLLSPEVADELDRRELSAGAGD